MSIEKRFNINKFINIRLEDGDVGGYPKIYVGADNVLLLRSVPVDQVFQIAEACAKLNNDRHLQYVEVCEVVVSRGWVLL